MKYFVLEHWKKGNQKFIQTSGIIGPYNFDASNSIYKIDYDQGISNDLWIPTLELHKKTAWTDHINTAYFNSLIAIICSPALYSIVKTHSTSERKDFPLSIVKGSEMKEYTISFLDKAHNELIDYKRSEFTTSQVKYELGMRREIVRFKSDQEMAKFQEDLKHKDVIWFLHYHTIYLTEDIPYDIFRLSGPVMKIVASDKFRMACIENKITGLEFIPFADIQVNPQFLAGHYTT